MHALRLIGKLLYSLIIFILPASISKRLFGKADFAFIANLRDADDLPNRSWLEGIIARFYIKSFRFNWPLLFSKIDGLYAKSGEPIKAWVIICPMTARQMIENRKLGGKKVLNSVRFAERIGSQSVNLAAFTSIVTRDGFDLMDKVNIAITTGNTYSALIAIENIQQASKLIDLDLNASTVAIIGAAGSVGSGCAQYLLGMVKELILIDINVNSIQDFDKRFNCKHTTIKASEDVDLIREADVVIAVTSALGKIVKEGYLKPGTIVVDASHPRNVSESVVKNRKDVLVIQSAIAKVAGFRCEFDFGLNKEEVFGCLGESVILSWMGDCKTNLLGKVDPSLMLKFKNFAPKAGVGLAPFRNTLGMISLEQIKYVHDIKKGSIHL